MDILTFIGGVISGFITKILYDELKSPNLTIGDYFGPLSENVNGKAIHFYRIKILNQPKRIPLLKIKILNKAAENCTASFHIFSNKNQVIRLWWRGKEKAVMINIDDFGELEFCGNYIGDEENILFPSEGWDRLLKLREKEISGILKVTCSNGRSCEKKFIISRKKDKILLKEGER